ncbi:MAG: FAD-dependent oxidoreductase [Pseudomonadota bacterium]
MPGSNLKKLFEPLDIGKMTIKNRVLMPAMATCFATADYFVSNQLISYYASRAEGGVGLIIVEATCIDEPVGITIPHEVCIDGDKYLPGLSKLAEAAHTHEAKILVQLHHGGPKVHFDSGQKPVVPSVIPVSGGHGPEPRELETDEIGGLVRKYAMGAKRAKKAGFDGVELLCAHGYLLNTFLSPHTNLRKDGYGGNLDGRIRIFREIVLAIKAEAGEDFPVLCKIPGDDYMDGGIVIEESIKICQILQDVGVDGITITGGGYTGARFTHIGPMGYPEGWQAHLAEKVKKNVRIPIAAMGKIKRPEFAEKLLADGKADMVAIGRALIAEPEFVNKAQRNETDQITPCICCNSCLDMIIDDGKAMRCTVNPLVGREYDTGVVAADRSRKVIVVGGGPAGMKAASVAASRGHDVTMYEKCDKLGGQLLLAAIPPDKEEITQFTEYLSNQLKIKGVDVRLNTEASKDLIESMHADAVIVATGASPAAPSIPGVDLDHVLTAWEALIHPEKAGKTVVVIGGGLVGCEAACFLAAQDRKVTIVEQLDNIGMDLGILSGLYEVARVQKAGIIIMTRTPAVEITKEGVAVRENGKTKMVAADTVVLAMGSKPNRGLLEALAAGKIEVHVIGDCVVPRKIMQATSQGLYVGCQV